MSYSFTVKAPTKAEAKVAVAAKLEEVVAQQTVHGHDCAQALSAAEAFIDIVEDNDTMDIQVSVSGSLGWRVLNDDALGKFNSVSVSIGVYFVTR